MMASKAKQGSVLVAVDFSDHSEAAFAEAAAMAECFRVPLHVLHVVHDPSDMPGYYNKKKPITKALRRMSDIAKEMMEEFMARMVETHPRSKVVRDAKTVLISGIPVTRILETVWQLQPRMLVMGSQGRTGLDHLLIGSKAEQCVRLCPVPVTIVKAHIAEK